MVTWQRTDLSMDPAMVQMADTDVRALAIDAGEAVESVTAEIVTLADTATVLDGILTDVAVNGDGDGAVLTVSGLTRGTTYEISVVFTRSDGTAWTKTLAVRCVA